MFIDKYAAANVLNKSPRTLIRYRQQGILIDGIHCALAGSKWLYHKELLEDLIACGMNPKHPDHQRAIAYCQKQKLGNKLKGQKKCQVT